VSEHRALRRAIRPSLWPFAVLLGLTAWVVVMSALLATGSAGGRSAVTVARFLAADGFLVAAVLRFLHWWAARDAVSARRAGGLALAAACFPVTTVLTPWTSVDGRLTPAGVVLRGVLLAAVIALLATQAGDRIRTTALALMAGAQTLRLAGVALPGRLDDVAPGLDVAAAVLLVVAAATDLRAVAQDERDREGALELQLATTQADLERQRARQRQRLHDARSAVAGVLGASAVLTDDESRSDGLPALVAAELRRLATVLGLDGVEPIETFDLAATLRPVLEMHALRCPQLQWHVEPVPALGRPRITATALDNLLRNARLHAPGAAVLVWSRVGEEGTAEIVVDDDGPGIPARERALVLGPGVRGSAAGCGGTGWGLYNAASAMAEQGGRLVLADSPGGGLRVTLSLPVGAPALTAA